MRLSILVALSAAALAAQTYGDIRLRVPAGWNATAKDGGVLLTPPGFNPANASEVYVAMAKPGFSSPDDPNLAAELAAENVNGAALRRTAFAAGTRPGVLYFWDFSHPQMGIPMTIRAYVTAARNTALVLVAIGTRELVTGRDAELRALAASLEFAGTPPVPMTQGALHDNSAAGREWAARLAGKNLTQMSSYSSSGGGGMSSRKDLALHAGGRYQYRYESSLSMDVGPYGGAPTASAMGASRDANQGQWRVITLQGRPVLEMRSDRGETFQQLLEFVDGKTFLNGTRTFVTP